MLSAYRRGFWLSYLVFLILFIFLTAFSSNLWRADSELILVGIGLLAILSGGWLLWRGVVRRAALPKTNLEWVITACILATLLSLVFSPNPQPGLWRVGWFIGYAVLFYALLDVFDAGVNRWGALAALMTGSGLILLFALIETFQWYQTWWGLVGSMLEIPPTQYRFTSFLSAPGPTMALANLCFPLAGLALAKFKNALVRVLCFYWLIIFLLTIPFSSSRGGWLGLAVTVAAGLGLIIWERKLWRVALAWPRKRKFQVISIAFVGLIVLLVGIYLFMTAFASHASHGGNPFGSSGRENIWGNAMDIWKTNPIFGAGPGRFSVAYQATPGGSSPAWWAVHAHSIFFQALAEFGVIGLVALIGLLLAGFWSAWKTFRQSSSSSKAWSGAILAALVGFLTQLTFDELSGWPVVMAVMVVVAAMLGTGEPGALKRFSRVRVSWGVVPLAAMLGAAAWSAWTYQPISGWQDALKVDGKWADAARLIHASASRDPSNVFYTGSEGLAWATDWGESGDPLALEQAREAIRRALAIEPGYSNLWANLAVLDWHAGAFDAAFSDIERAIQIAPKEYSYQLNRAWFLEQRGDEAGAIAGYVKALSLSPQRANHPFWGSTDPRRQALQEWQQVAPESPMVKSYWQDALADVERGDFSSARMNLARSWATEGGLPMLMVEGQLLEAQGKAEDALAMYAKIADQLQTPKPMFDMGQHSLGVFSVPGYLSLEPDWGQFALMERLVALYRSRGECRLAEQVWRVMERERGGGVRKILKMPSCP